MLFNSCGDDDNAKNQRTKKYIKKNERSENSSTQSKEAEPRSWARERESSMIIAGIVTELEYSVYDNHQKTHQGHIVWIGSEW